MRLRLYYLTLAFVALIALLPIAYGFFPVNALGPTTEFKSRRYETNPKARRYD
jgi:hypothetical protein